jgi:hypothetical protein
MRLLPHPIPLDSPVRANHLTGAYAPATIAHVIPCNVLDQQRRHLRPKLDALAAALARTRSLFAVFLRVLLLEY